MGTAFLGEPPSHIKEWIEVVKSKTHIKFTDGTEDDYLIEGAMDCPALIAAGLMPPGSGTELEPSWIKYPVEVKIGSAVTTIGSYAFYGCSGLTSVSIPDKVTSIGDWTFYNCRGLTNVTIPDSVTSIGNHAFYNCDSLTNMTIVNGIVSIENWTFAWCKRLTSVTIPDSVTSIGYSAFNYCSSLTSVEFEGNAPTVGANAFEDVASGCKAVISSTATGFPAAG